MREKYAAKGEAITEEFFNSVTHEARTLHWRCRFAPACRLSATQQF
jgi:hypothetical protein